MHKKIKVASGEYTLIDAEDFDYLNSFKWRLSNGYPARTAKSIAMHRVLMEAGRGQYVDHINGNKLDNRKANLRLCTQQENTCNQKLRGNNKSGFKGVSWHKAAKKYEAYIWVNYQKIYLGLFKSKKKAVEAYAFASLNLHKEFRRLA